MKKLRFIAFAVLASILLVVPLSASVVWDTSTISRELADEISDTLFEVSLRHPGMDFGIRISDDSQGISPAAAAEKFASGLGPDNLVLYINMTDRELFIGRSGRAWDYFTDRDLDRIIDAIVRAMQQAEIAGENMPQAGMTTFLTMVDQHIAAVYAPRDFSGLALMALGVGVATGAIVVAAMVYQNSRSLPAPPRAQTYLDKDGMRVTRQKDTFLRTFTTRTPISQNTGGGGRGGGGGGRSFGGRGGRF